MKILMYFSLVLSIGLISLSLSACGGGSDEKGQGSSPAPEKLVRNDNIQANIGNSTHVWRIDSETEVTWSIWTNGNHLTRTGTYTYYVNPTTGSDGSQSTEGSSSATVTMQFLNNSGADDAEVSMELDFTAPQYANAQIEVKTHSSEYPYYTNNVYNNVSIYLCKP